MSFGTWASNRIICLSCFSQIGRGHFSRDVSKRGVLPAASKSGRYYLWWRWDPASGSRIQQWVRSQTGDFVWKEQWRDRGAPRGMRWLKSSQTRLMSWWIPQWRTINWLSHGCVVPGIPVGLLDLFNSLSWDRKVLSVITSFSVWHFCCISLGNTFYHFVDKTLPPSTESQFAETSSSEACNLVFITATAATKIQFRSQEAAI